MLKITESTKHKIYEASIGMVHGEIGQHKELLEFLQEKGEIYSGEENQPVQKFSNIFRLWVVNTGYEPKY